MESPSLAALSQHDANPSPTPNDRRPPGRLQCRICCFRKTFEATKQPSATKQQTGAPPKDPLVLISHFIHHESGRRPLPFVLPGFPSSVVHSNFTAVPFQFFSTPTILHKAYPRNKTLIANVAIPHVFLLFRELNTCSVLLNTLFAVVHDCLSARHARFYSPKATDIRARSQVQGTVSWNIAGK
jgi:hypothetical protein